MTLYALSAGYVLIYLAIGLFLGLVALIAVPGSLATRLTNFVMLTLFWVPLMLYSGIKASRG